MNPSLLRLAQAALAFRSSGDLPALTGIFGETASECLGGYAWRFFLVDPQSGALRHAGPAAKGDGPDRVHLPEPGGALEWLLAYEAPLVARADERGAPGLERALWPRVPEAIAGIPVHGSATLHGLLIVALDGAPPVPAVSNAPVGFPAPGVPSEALLTARALADQFALALEREALARRLEGERERMSRLELKANAGEELFSELISVVAHEIRTPLTSIKAYTESLIDAPAGEFEQRRDFLTVINDECDRLARLIGDALDLSRLEVGQRALKVKPCDPRALFEDLALTLEPELAKSGLSLVTGVGAELTDLEADLDLLKQLLLNLVGNAIKFSPRAATVTLEARADGPAWTLSVRDTGGGIPEDQLDRVFERFYRVELKGGRRVPGTGLGLAIARHIVDLHGGTIRADNAPGGGSVFSARLPRRQLAPVSVRRVSRELAQRADVRGLLDDAIAAIGEVMEAEIVSILLVDPDEGDLFVATARGLADAARARRMHYRGGVAGAAVHAGRPLLINNIETDRRIARRNHPQYFTKSLLCAPLTVSGQTVGVINVNNKASREEFDEHDLVLLSGLIERLAGALNRAHAYPDAPQVVAEARAAVRSIGRVKRDLLVGRSELGRCAGAVARRVGLAPDIAALVGRLAGGAGPQALASGLGLAPAPAPAPAPAAEPGFAAEARGILLARAERLDGSGHPAGLRADAIPLGARILAVMDEFERLTQARPYRGALPVEDALAVLVQDGGRRYDARVVQALASVLSDEGLASDQKEAA